MSEILGLPVPVGEHPRWRVNIRPKAYDPQVLRSHAECIRLVEKNAVRLRGWDYPHLGRDAERGYGDNWVASWCHFMGHIEYWRLYRSSQFIHLFSVREATDPSWGEKLRTTTAQHLRNQRNVDWASVPGFLSVVNTVYCVTEIVEFATRLAQAGVYRGELELSLSIQGIKGFVLTTEWDRAWMHYYAASEESVRNTRSVSTESLLSDSTQHSLELVVGLFERFGWLEPSLDVLRKDIDDFKSGRG